MKQKRNPIVTIVNGVGGGLVLNASCFHLAWNRDNCFSFSLHFVQLFSCFAFNTLKSLSFRILLDQFLFLWILFSVLITFILFCFNGKKMDKCKKWLKKKKKNIKYSILMITFWNKLTGLQWNNFCLWTNGSRKDFYYGRHARSSRTSRNNSEFFFSHFWQGRTKWKQTVSRSCILSWNLQWRNSRFAF